MTISSVRSALPGRWQSTQDELYAVAFDADGTTRDIYNDKTKNSGTWELYEDKTYPSVVFLRKEFDAETYEYAVLVANQEQLAISYMSRGNTLDFRRIN